MDREERETRHPVTSIVSRVEDTHRRIRSDLEVLENSDDLGQMRAVADDLPNLLEEHFRDEQKPGGLFEEMEFLRPLLKPQLDMLRQEHREIIRALEDLQRQLHGVDVATEGDQPEQGHDKIRVSAAGFVQLIQQHERIESNLVADTYYAEDGGSG